VGTPLRPAGCRRPQPPPGPRTHGRGHRGGSAVARLAPRPAAPPPCGRLRGAARPPLRVPARSPEGSGVGMRARRGIDEEGRHTAARRANARRQSCREGCMGRFPIARPPSALLRAGFRRWPRCGTGRDRRLPPCLAAGSFSASLGDQGIDDVLNLSLLLARQFLDDADALFPF
jgi:hypothetical protein